MEQIVLEVDRASARAWRNSSPDVKSLYENKINELFSDLKEAEFDQLLNKAGKIAGTNSLTKEN